MDKVYHFSAPGRTEIGGNHTDHQHGCVLAAAVDMTTTAEVRLNGTNVIRVDSEGYRPVEIDLSDLKIREEEKNTTAALIRGVAAAFAQRQQRTQRRSFAAGFHCRGQFPGLIPPRSFPANDILSRVNLKNSILQIALRIGWFSQIGACFLQSGLFQ